MSKTASAIVLSCVLACSATAAEGVISLPSGYSVEETADRFAGLIEQKGLKLFARINHAKNAAAAGLKLRPTEVILFGNPKAGTPLMQCAQTAAIDLPQKALVWEDASGKVWFSYNDPAYLSKRHKLAGCDKVVDKISAVLGKLSKAATTKQKQP